jgi:hypothetical protein
MATMRSLDGIYGTAPVLTATSSGRSAPGAAPPPAPASSASPGLPSYLQDILASLPPDVANSIGLGPKPAASSQRAGNLAPAPGQGAIDFVGQRTGVQAPQPMQRNIPIEGGAVPPSTHLGAPGGPAPSAAGAMQQPMTPANPNAHQMTPQAQAQIQALRDRMSLPDVQGKAFDRGVFSGGQQAVAMPTPPNGGRLSGLYGG